MLAQELQRKRQCQPLHRLGVDAEPQGACESHVNGLFPVTGIALQVRCEPVGLGVSPLIGESRYPVAHMQRVYRGYLRRAGEINVRTSHEQVIAAAELGGAPHHHLRYGLAVAPCYGRVVAVHHMQHHRVVGRIGVMAVAVPVACADMHLHVSCPYAVTYLDLGVEKVGAGIFVVSPRIYNRHPAPVHSDHVGRGKQPVLPHIVHQTLHRCQVLLCFYQVVYLVAASWRGRLGGCG